MQVYGFPASPFVRKALVVAAEKGIAVDNVIFHPRQPLPEFLAASPFGKIPALRDGEFTLADSTAIATYFDALRPEPAIWPVEPRAQARAVWFEEVADTVMVAAGAKIVFNRFVAPTFLGMPGNEEAALQGEAELAPILAYLEAQAPDAGFLTGEAYSLGDIAIASVLRTLRYVDRCPTAESHPALAAWHGRVLVRPAWQQVLEHERKLVEARIAAGA